MGRRTGEAAAARAAVERVPDELDELRRQVRALTAQVTALRRGRGRFALEREAASAASSAVSKLRARAERAEAELADVRRDSARAIIGLRREITFWRLVADGVDRASAARQAGMVADEPARRP